MSDFFESDLVIQSMEELAEMQQDLIRQVLYVPYMTREQKQEHLQLMKDFLEKQKNLFFRMSLSDDPEAQRIKTEIIESAQMFGVVKDTNTEDFFKALEKTIEGLAKMIEMS